MKIEVEVDIDKVVEKVAKGGFVTEANLAAKIKLEVHEAENWFEKDYSIHEFWLTDLIAQLQNAKVALDEINKKRLEETSQRPAL